MWIKFILIKEERGRGRCPSYYIWKGEGENIYKNANTRIIFYDKRSEKGTQLSFAQGNCSITNSKTSFYFQIANVTCWLNCCMAYHISSLGEIYLISLEIGSSEFRFRFRLCKEKYFPTPISLFSSLFISLIIWEER